MILDKDFFDSLSAGSNKKVKLKCDYCNTEFERAKKIIVKSYSIITNDACNKCKFKKRADIEEKKTGFRNSAQRDNVRKKISEYAQKENIFFDKEFQDGLDRKSNAAKAKKTVQERYGVNNISQVKEFQQKKEKTCLNKYGAKSYIKSDEAINKYINKFGTDNVFKLPEYQDKARKTIEEKYGDHHLRIHSIKEKIKQTKIDRGYIRVFDGKLSKQWAEEIGFSESHFNRLIKNYGFEKAKTMTPTISSLEQILMDILDRNNIKYTHQFRTGGYIADFLLDDYNIIIECDGLYWHSELFVDKNYHLDKRLYYISAGYTPLFFREDELLNKANIVESIILNKCGRSSRIFARKTTFREVNDRDFFSSNHLMGKGAGKIYGLYTDELVCSMQVKRIKNQDYEISRFCTKLGVNIIGGFSKILKHLPKMNSLTTFIDLRYGQGNYLESLDFKEQKSYLSFRWTSGPKSFHRMKFPSNSGYDAGLVKIWDCGQKKYQLFYK